MAVFFDNLYSKQPDWYHRFSYCENHYISDYSIFPASNHSINGLTFLSNSIVFIFVYSGYSFPNYGPSSFIFNFIFFHFCIYNSTVPKWQKARALLAAIGFSVMVKFSFGNNFWIGVSGYFVFRRQQPIITKI